MVVVVTVVVIVVVVAVAVVAVGVVDTIKQMIVKRKYFKFWFLLMLTVRSSTETHALPFQVYQTKLSEGQSLIPA